MKAFVAHSEYWLLGRATLGWFCVTVIVGSAMASETNWPSWRGAGDHGVRSGGNFPEKLDETKIVWKTPLPGKGCSTPIVWNQRIFVTAPIDGNDAVLAFDWSGKRTWAAKFGAEDAGKHRNGSGSNPSPATDGKGVFVYFKSGTFAALELDGKVRWKMDLVEKYGKEQLFWDHGTSPVLTEKHVVMARMHGGDSWIAAFDKASGELAWKVPRNYKTPTEVDNGYTTPLVIRQGGKEALLVWGAQHLTAHDAADGSVIWSCGDFNPDAQAMWPAISSPVVAGDMAVVSFGRADRRQPRLHGVRLGGSGDVTATHHVWRRQDAGAFVPTPSVYGGNVYLLNDRGEVQCIDPASGEVMWRKALPGSSRNYYASPLIAGGKLYAVREDGVMFVARVEGEFEVISESAIGEPVIASPVAAANRLLIRGEQHLICVSGE